MSLNGPTLLNSVPKSCRFRPPSGSPPARSFAFRRRCPAISSLGNTKGMSVPPPPLVGLTRNQQHDLITS